MTDHPSLQPYTDAWNESIEAVFELVKPLVEGEWNRRTDLPGWSVRDIVSHLIGLECELIGDPRPIHQLPRDLYHVVDEPSRHMEIQVDVRRHHTGAEMVSELEYTLIRRRRQLRNEKRGPEAEVRSIMPGGGQISLEKQLRMRAFDVWVHEQDLRRALGQPGNLDSQGAHISRDLLIEALPKVVAKQSRPNSVVVFDVGGEVEFLRTVRVDAEGRGRVDGSPSLGPTLTLSMDWETYVVLATGRKSPGAVADKVKAEGDEALAKAILENFSITP